MHAFPIDLLEDDVDMVDDEKEMAKKFEKVGCEGGRKCGI